MMPNGQRELYVKASQVLNVIIILFKGCSFTLSETYGEIDFDVSSGDCLLALWNIQTAGISQAVALISVQDLNLKYCR